MDLRLYRVIYQAIEDVEAAMKGMLDPIFEEQVIGHGEVRQTFKASGVGTIAGSYVLDGRFERNCKVKTVYSRRAHSVCCLTYHAVFVVKYRRKVISPGIMDFLRFMRNI